MLHAFILEFSKQMNRKKNDQKLDNDHFEVTVQQIKNILVSFTMKKENNRPASNVRSVTINAQILTLSINSSHSYLLKEELNLIAKGLPSAAAEFLAFPARNKNAWREYKNRGQQAPSL